MDMPLAKALKNYKNSECSKDFVEACSRWKRLIMAQWKNTGGKFQFC